MAVPNPNPTNFSRVGAVCSKNLTTARYSPVGVTLFCSFIQGTNVAYSRKHPFAGYWGDVSQLGLCSG
jgi:hypothetical protein